MLLIFAIAALVGLRYFEIGPFATISWWWVVLAMVGAFIWFEFIERILGLDRKKSDDKLIKAREDRVKRAFDKRK